MQRQLNACAPCGTTAGRPPASRPRGFTLIENLMALLLFSVGILGFVGIQAFMMTNNIDAKYRVDASFLANDIVSRMWTDRANLANYVTTPGTANPTTAAWSTQIGSTLPAGTGRVQLATEPNDVTEVTVTVTWQPPGAPAPHQFITISRIAPPETP
ncbi:MAG: type IV pilus modification PilV family protein [Pseudomonadota bacterium]